MGEPDAPRDPPPVDERLVMPESRAEILRGAPLISPPADEPHGTSHFDLTYVRAAHVAEGTGARSTCRRGPGTTRTSTRALRPLEDRWREEGREEGRLLARREHVRDLCELAGVELDPARRAALDAMGASELDALVARLERDRAGP